MSYITNAMIAVMDFLYRLTSSWGLSVIGLTVLVRLILLPLTVSQARSTRKLAVLQPEVERIQKKYKDDPERMQLEVMEVYRQNKVNPASGCILLAIQFPILIAIIRALEAHPALKEATFMGIALGKSAGEAPTIWKFLIPLIAAGTTFLAMKFSPSMGASGQQQAGAQNVMLVAMMMVMLYFSYKFAVAVSVYIITGNFVGFLERYLVPQEAPVTRGSRTK